MFFVLPFVLAAEVYPRAGIHLFNIFVFFAPEDEIQGRTTSGVRMLSHAEQCTIYYYSSFLASIGRGSKIQTQVTCASLFVSLSVFTHGDGFDRRECALFVQVHFV